MTLLTNRMIRIKNQDNLQINCPDFDSVLYLGSNNSTNNNATAPRDVASSPNLEIATSVFLASSVKPLSLMVFLIGSKINCSDFETPPPNIINSGFIM